MLLEGILNNLPSYAKDIKLNFSSILNNHNLMSENQFYGTILAAALASRNCTLTKALNQELNSYLDAKVQAAVGAAATIMAMNNIYYRFTDLIEDEQYRKMPAGLRMNVIKEHEVNSVDFELWCLAVSVINGCSMCINAHAKQLINAGISRDIIQFTAKVAAITHALARALELISE